MLNVDIKSAGELARLNAAFVVHEVHHGAHGIPLDFLGQHKVIYEIEKRGCNGSVQHLHRNAMSSF